MKGDAQRMDLLANPKAVKWVDLTLPHEFLYARGADVRRLIDSVIAKRTKRGRKP